MQKRQKSKSSLMHVLQKRKNMQMTAFLLLKTKLPVLNARSMRVWRKLRNTSMTAPRKLTVQLQDLSRDLTADIKKRSEHSKIRSTERLKQDRSRRKAELMHLMKSLAAST